MRLAIVDPYYHAFLVAHYETHPDLANGSYEEQFAALMNTNFGTSDAYSWHLREIGHEATELVVNCFEAQRRWAAERRINTVLRGLSSLPSAAGRAARWRLVREVSRAQIEWIDPDVVYFQDLTFFSPRELRAIRRRGRVVVGQIASPAPSIEVLRAYDLIITSFPHFVRRFRKQRIDTRYQKLAFDERVLERLRMRGGDPSPASPRDYPVTFIGGLDPAVHRHRTALLERIVAHVPLNIWGWGIDSLPASSPIRSRYRGHLWGLDMYEVLSRSRISLNGHIDAAEGYANNMRLFESTGVGALLVTESAPNLDDLFAPGEVVDYKDERDLVEKIQYFLGHDDERIARAAAGQKRTLTHHTYRQRAPELVAMLSPRLSSSSLHVPRHAGVSP